MCHTLLFFHDKIILVTFVGNKIPYCYCIFSPALIVVSKLIFLSYRKVNNVLIK